MDADGIPQFRGATEERALQIVAEAIKVAERWLSAMAEGAAPDSPRMLEERILKSEIKQLSEADVQRFDQLRAIAQELNGFKMVHLDAENIDTVLSLTTGISYSPTVKRVLIRWASLYLK